MGFNGPGEVVVFGVLLVLGLVLVHRLTLTEGRERGAREEGDVRVVRSAEVPEHMDMRDLLPGATFHRFPAIQEYLEDLARRHPAFVHLEEVGRSHEGRPLLGLRVGRGALGAATPTVLVDAGMHGREWVTVATVLATIGNLIKLFLGAEDCAAQALTGIDWWVLHPHHPLPPGTSCLSSTPMVTSSRTRRTGSPVLPCG